ncbi:MAG: hypothetical protein QW117_01395 [Candidatus Pacearchaeota archaeon]
MRDGEDIFLNIELIIFLIMGIITLIEFYNFNIFEKFFLLIKPYVSWFISISFGFVFRQSLNPFKKKIISNKKFEDKKENFLFFSLNLIIISIIISFTQKIVISFFNSLLIYFHVLFLQWIILIYIAFKLSNGYVISKKYFITNEIIAIIYSVLIYSYFKFF